MACENVLVAQKISSLEKTSRKDLLKFGPEMKSLPLAIQKTGDGEERKGWIWKALSTWMNQNFN